ncbi:MAG: hypothetical protein IJN42_01570, partial [Clostridia bacterium]|nr:hypothetical protein [Clostridia bacterium]
MKTKLWLRALSLLLCLLLCVQCCTFVAAAETETETSAPEEPAPVVEGELTEKRTANEKYFMRSDQSILAAVYPNAVHYQDTDGNWQEIDNRLQESETDGVTELGNTAGPWSVKFAKKAKDGKLARLQYGDAKLSWSLNGAVKTTGQLPEIANETPEDPLVLSGVTSGVRYEGILPEVDLEYLLIGDQIKENIILNSADAPGSFTFTYNTGAATMTLTDNVITLWEGETALLSLNAPIMTDAAGNSSGAITLSLQTVKANEGNHVYTVTVTPDAAWLQMAGRVYPVTVDPTLTTPQEQSKIFDTYTDSSNPTVN